MSGSVGYNHQRGTKGRRASSHGSAGLTPSRYLIPDRDTQATFASDARHIRVSSFAEGPQGCDVATSRRVIQPRLRAASTRRRSSPDPSPNSRDRRPVKGTPPAGAGKEARDREPPLAAEDEDALLPRYAAERVTRDPRGARAAFMPLARSLAMRYPAPDRAGRGLRPGRRPRAGEGDRGVRPRHERGLPAYAVPTILGELRRHFRDDVWNVRLPRGLGELTMRVDVATTADRGARAVSDPDRDRARLSVSVEDVLRRSRPVTPADAVARRSTRADDDDASTGVEPILDSELGDAGSRPSSPPCAGLSQREWEVLRMRFVDELTQQEIGDRLGVSQMRSRGSVGGRCGAARGGPWRGRKRPGAGVDEPRRGRGERTSG